MSDEIVARLQTCLAYGVGRLLRGENQAMLDAIDRIQELEAEVRQLSDWVAVPREPTEAEIDAGIAALQGTDLLKEDYISIIKRIRQAMLSAALQPPDSECVWTADSDGSWDTDCGETWQFTDGGPTENRCRYCHRCGKPIVVQHYVEDYEEQT